MALNSFGHRMGTSSVPAFLVKLVNLLEDPENNEIITWNHDGTTFHIYDQSRLAKEVLPLYFKHNNIASFIRQLNMYGFRKMVEHTGLKIEHEDLQFAHPYFIRGREDLLENIKRKVSMPAAMRAPEETKLSKDDVHKVLQEVKDIKYKQEHVSSKIGSLKRENEALWREVASLRQKHQRQQTIVNKLISFLVRVVGTRGMAAATKRKLLPLMLESSTPSEQGPSRRAKTPRQYYDVEMPSTPYMRADSGDSVDKVTNKGGILIQEVESPSSSHQQVEGAIDPVETFNFDDPAISLVNFGESDLPSVDLPSVESNLNASGGINADMLDDPVVIANAREVMAESLGQPVSSFDNGRNNSMATNTSTPATIGTSIGPGTSNTQVVQSSKGGSIKKGKRTKSGNLKLKIEPDFGTVANASPTRIGEEALDQLTMTMPKTITAAAPFTPEIMDGHLDGVQYDLESIKDLLSGGYNFDTETMYKLFSADDPIPTSSDHLLKSLEDSNDPTVDADKIMGHELIQFSNAPDDLSVLFDLGDVPPVDPDDNDDLNSDLNTPLVTPLSGDSLNRTTSFVSKLKGKMEEVD